MGFSDDPTSTPITASQLRAVDFRRRFRGYDCDAVDDFLALVERTLAGEIDPSRAVTVDAIRDVTFPERFRGYDADAVDNVLERAGASIAALG